MITSFTLLNYNFYRKVKLFLVLIFFQSVIARSQVATNYGFAQGNVAIGGFIGGGTVLATGGGIGAPTDDAVFPNQNIGFNFRFNGVTYTQLGVSTNGFIWFGNPSPTATTYSPISTATGYAGVISAYGQDLIGQTAASELRIQTQGVAPNRTFTIQWRQYQAKLLANASQNRMDLWIILNECSNVIRISLSANQYLWTTGVACTGEVGLRGANNADFFNRNVACGPAWNGSTAGGSSNTTAQMGGGIFTACWPGTIGGVPCTYTYTPTTSPPIINCTNPSAQCVGASVSIPVNVIGGYSPYDINWTSSIGTPASGSATGIAFPYNGVTSSYLSIGTTNYSITVTDGAGCQTICNGAFAINSCVLNTITTGALAAGPFCACGTVSVPFTSTGTFNAGNIYTAQLSDALGSFASPVNIGTLASTANSGNISATIPCNANGAAYRIRVISSNPSVTGTDNGTNFTINVAPVILVTPSAASICVGGNVSLTASGGTSYTWTPATGLGATAGASVTSSPASTTTYTVTGSNAGGCTAQATVVVSIGISNDNCANAVNLPVNGSALQGFTCGSSLQPGEATDCATFGSDQSVWYSFVATATNLAVIIDRTGGSCFFSSAVWSSSSGCPATGICHPLSCQSSSNGPAGTAHSLSSLTIGATYYVQILYTGAACGDYLSFDISVSTTIPVNPSNPAPFSNCNTPSGSICVLNFNPIFNFQITGTCPGYLSPANGNSVNEVVNVCFNFTSQYSSSISFQALITSSCGAGNVVWYDWTIYDNSCNTFACGNLGNMNASGLLCGNNYKMCISYEVPNCTHTNIYPYIVAVPPAFVVTPNGSSNTGSVTICRGNSTTLSANAAGYVSYQWSPVAGLSATTGASITASPTVNTTYTVVGFDAGGCSQSGTIAVTVNPIPTISVNPIQFCEGSSGSLTGTGTSTSYRWSPSGGLSATLGTTVTANPTVTTTYTVVGTNAATCTAQTTVVVTVNPRPQITPSSTNASCGNSNGTVGAVISNGTPVYNYAWSNGASVANISGLGAGSYSLTVSDANNCTATSSLSITNSAGPGLILNPVDISCNGNTNGNISTSVTGGVLPLTYKWSNGATTPNISGLAAGTYNITVTDAGNCTVNSSAIIAMPSVISIIMNSVNVTCNGGFNGSVTPVVSGGTGAYTYKWSNNATTASISNLMLGGYSLTVTDSNGCTQTGGALITQPSPILVAMFPSNITCNGSNNGNIDNTVIGGMPPFTYLWSNGETTKNISNLSPGSYTVTVTDDFGCTGKNSSTLNQPTILNLSAVPTDVSCFNGNSGNIILTVNGGGTSYSYQWTNGATTKDISGLFAGTYAVTVTDNLGCARSTFGIINQPNPILPTNLSAQICQGQSYNLPWGGSVTTANTYSNTYQTASGCDSVVNITLTVNPIFTTNLSAQICQGQSYNLPWGGSVTIANTYSNTYQTASGCDSVVNIALTVNSIFTTNLSDQICSGQSYNLPWGGNVTTANTYSNTYQTASGCDSVVNITLTVNPIFTTNLSAQICSGQSYNLPWGGSVTTANSYSNTYQTASGCDSVVNITLTVNPIFTTNLSAQICSGQSYNLPWGGAVTTANTYSNTYQTASGCDSIVNITLTVNPIFTTNLSAQICSGQSYNLPWGGSVTTANTYSNIYQTASGCDSVVNIALTVGSTFITNLTAQICQGQSYNLPWGGSVTTANTYSNTYQTASGCDSIVNITLTVNPVFTTNLSDQICSGQSYNLPWGGSVTIANTYSNTYQTASGCDSVVNIALTVNSIFTTNLSAQICSGQSYNLPWGGSVTIANTYSNTYQTASGCDSVVNIALTVNSIFTTNLSNQICSGQSYNLPWGGSVTTANTYSNTYQTASGCDSVVNITLTVNPIFTTNLSAQICSGQSYNLPWGGAVTTANTYSNTYQTASGCDSVVNITLTVDPIFTTNLNAQICDGQSYNLPWGGSVTTANTYSNTYQTASGCDSIVNITLTVNPIFTTNLSDQICSGQSYNLPWGGAVTTANTYSNTYQTASGCDSVVNIAFTVNPIFTTNLSAQICQGQSYNLPWGGSVTTANSYSNTYQTASGCDSVVNIALTVNSIFTTNLSAQICSGQSYNLPWGGSVTTANTYSNTYQTASGCDSVVNIALTVNPIFTTNLSAQICQGQSYNLPWGGSVTTANTYSNTYQTASGCDSVVNIALAVGSTFITNLTAQICQGQSYNLPWGGSVTIANTYSNTYQTASGCDSVVNIALTVGSTFITNLTAQICQGQSYNLPWGGSVTTVNTYSNTYQTASGCDSIVNITLTVNPVFTTNLSDQICSGQSYNLPWGGSVTIANTYSNTYQTASGCDSVVNIALAVGSTFITNLTAQICQGQSYNLPWGGNVTTANTYSNTYQTASGCDSVVNIALTVNSIFTTNLSAQICSGQSYNLPWGGSVTISNTYSNTYQTASGCDSVVNIALTVNSIFTTNLSNQICSGQSYNLPWGGSVTTANTYSNTYQTASGCDSVVNITLTVNPIFTTNLSAQICSGQSYNLPWGGAVTTANTYSNTYQTASGCDSVVNITLTVDPIFTTNLNAQICDGQSYNLPWGGSVTTANTYSNTYQTASGCDSVVNIALTVGSTFITNLTAQICQGQSYNLPWGGSVTIANTYSNTYQTASGCDSVVNIALTVGSTFITNLSAQICQGQSYNLPWGGSVTTANTYSNIYQTASGCDSVVNITLTVNPIFTTNLSAQICQGQSYNLPWGGSVTIANTYSNTYQTASGCDSVVNIALTVGSTFITNLSAQICQGQSYNLPWGGSVTTANTYSNIYQTASGCDSVVNITLTVNPIFTTNLSAQICQGQSYNLPWGGSVTIANTYSNTYQTASGCDSVVNIALTVNSIFTTNLSAQICSGQSYNLPWGGSVTTANTYSNTYQTASGCDSVVNIALTVGSTIITNLNAQICQGQSYNLPWGGSVTIANTYSNTYQTASGCDSVVNIALTVNSIFTTNLSAQICQGQSYNLPWGGSVTTANTYSNIYQTASGCDSVVNITLTVNPIFTTNLSAQICSGQSYNLPWGGSVTTANTYSNTYQTASGCDSVVNIALTVGSTFITNLTAQICQGQSYNLPWGGSVTIANTYSNTYQTASGCDSVVNITLTVNPIFTTNLSAQICQGQSYNLPWGSSVTIANTYSNTYQAASGCDSVVNITLTVNPIFTTNLSAQICQGQSYNLPWGGSVTTANTYSNTYQTASGCDSVVNIALAVGSTFITNLTAQICQGQSYNLPWGGSVTTANTYSNTYQTASGCDSVVNIALTVGSTIITNLNAQICQGQSYNLPWGGSVTTANTYSNTYQTASGCDSIVNITLTVNPIFTTNLSAQICSGQSYNLPWGGSVTTANTYSNTYQTASGCDSVVNIALTVGSTIITNLNAQICQGQSYNLPWGGSVTTANTYSNTYQTASGCDSVVNITLTVNPVFTTNLSAQICDGQSYNLPWGGSVTTANTYSNTYQTASGCDSVVNITLTVNPIFTTNLSAQICQGKSYNLPWGGSVTTANTYSNTYQTASGCDSVVNITLTVNPIFTTNLSAQICQGQSYNLPWGGSVTTANTYSNTYQTASGCDSVVNIALTVGSTIITNLSAQICQGQSYNLPWGGSVTTANTYSNTYQTASGCDSVVNITLTVNPIFTTNLSAQICSGQSYNLPWGGTVNTIGVYSHTYLSASGCDSTVNINILVNSIVVNESHTNATCSNSNGTITLTVSNGNSPYTYNWNNGSITKDISNLPANNFRVTVTDQNGCSATTSVNIGNTNGPALSETHNNPNCGSNNGSIDLTVSGGVLPYSFYWNNSASVQNLTGVGRGTYSVTVTDANSCSSTTTIVLNCIQPPPCLLSVLINTSDVSCNSNCDGSAFASSSNGTSPYSYSWSNGASVQNLTGLCAGTYSVIVSDINGCADTASVTITEPDVLLVNSSISNVLCNGNSTGAIDLSVAGGTIPYSFNWSNMETTEDINNLSAGSYSVTVTDKNNCTSILALSIDEPGSIIIDTVTTPSTCGNINGSADITVSGGISPYTYNWNNSTTTQDLVNVASGSYSITVTDNNGCLSSITVNISGTLPPQIYISPLSAALCIGNSTQLTATGADTYSWTPNLDLNNATGATVTASPTSSTTYTVIGTEQLNGCSNSATVTVTVYQSPVITISNSNSNICPGQVALLNAGGANSYVWTPNAGLSATTGSIVTATPSINTTYKVIGISQQGCSDSATTAIAVGEYADIDIGLLPEEGCAPLVVSFVNNSGNAFSYLWKFGDNSNSADVNPVHTYFDAGSYPVNLIVTSTTGCVTDTVIATIQVFLVPSADFSVRPDFRVVTVLSDATFEFTNLSADATIYQWQFGDETSSTLVNPVHTYKSTGEYNVSLVASNERGCSDTIEMGPVIITPDGDVFIPNSFTPNGDGINDEFKIYGKGIQNYRMMIYNRWGENIYTSDQHFPSWDGTFRNLPINVGVYVYLIEIQFMDGRVLLRKGDITLLR